MLSGAEGLERGGPEGGARQQQATDTEDGDGKEMHNEDGGPRVEARQQADGARAVPAAQAQVVEASLPHLLVRCAAPIAEHLRTDHHRQPHLICLHFYD